MCIRDSASRRCGRSPLRPGSGSDMQTRLLASLVVLVLAAPAFVVGQQAPTFRSGVNLILVDVTVRDGKGQPIRNLTAADFEILENGKPQSIVTFAHEEVAQPTQTIKASATLTRILSLIHI